MTDIEKEQIGNTLSEMKLMQKRLGQLISDVQHYVDRDRIKEKMKEFEGALDAAWLDVSSGK